jgi:hypothetical protein
MHVEVTEFNKHPQFSFKIAMEHYRHQSFYENTVVVSLQSIEFNSADINYLFYICHIVV